MRTKVSVFKYQASSLKSVDAVNQECVKYSMRKAYPSYSSVRLKLAGHPANGLDEGITRTKES